MLGGIRWLVLYLCAGLAGCQSLGGAGYLPISEVENFTPMGVEQRLMSVVKMRWEVRADVAEHCSSAMGISKERMGNTPPPLACAIWSVPNKECTIVTGPTTSHLALGHEARHCSEGHFH